MRAGIDDDEIVGAARLKRVDVRPKDVVRIVELVDCRKRLVDTFERARGRDEIHAGRKLNVKLRVIH